MGLGKEKKETAEGEPQPANRGREDGEDGGGRLIQLFCEQEALLLQRAKRVKLFLSFSSDKMTKFATRELSTPTPRLYPLDHPFISSLGVLCSLFFKLWVLFFHFLSFFSFQHTGGCSLSLAFFVFVSALTRSLLTLLSRFLQNILLLSALSYTRILS
jgi:hypothetical protein